MIATNSPGPSSGRTDEPKPEQVHEPLTVRARQPHNPQRPKPEDAALSQVRAAGRIAYGGHEGPSSAPRTGGRLGQTNHGLPRPSRGLSGPEAYNAGLQGLMAGKAESTFDPKAFATVGPGRHRVRLTQGRSGLPAVGVADAVFYIQKGKIKIVSRPPRVRKQWSAS
jgi:hypothetical protein